MKTKTIRSCWIRCGVVALVAVAGNLFASTPAYKVDRSIGRNEFKRIPSASSWMPVISSMCCCGTAPS